MSVQGSVIQWMLHHSPTAAPIHMVFEKGMFNIQHGNDVITPAFGSDYDWDEFWAKMLVAQQFYDDFMLSQRTERMGR
jgi:hypothetical protein